MKKVLKIVAGIIIVLLVLLIGFVISLPLTISPIVKKAAAAGGPRFLGVDVSVGDVQLKPMAGQLIITDLKVGNPDGYTEKDSFAVKTVDVKLQTSSLLKGDTVCLEKIMIEAPAIFFEKKSGKSNFDAMLSNAQQAEKKEQSEKTGGSEKKAGKKVIIKEFVLKDGEVAYASSLTFGKPVTLPLPTLSLEGIGEKSGGVSAVEAIGDIMSSILNSLTDVVAGAAAKAVGLGAGALNTGSNAVKSAAEGTGDLIKGATEGTGDLIKGAADSTGEAVKGATDKLKGLFGK